MQGVAIFLKKALADIEWQYIVTWLGEKLLVLDDFGINIEEIKRILKSESYEARFRLLVLNPDETVRYEIPQEDIILNSGTYSENYQNGQRRSFTISLVNTDGKYTPKKDNLWVNTKFRFDVGIEYKGEEYFVPRGVYILQNPQSIRGDSDKQIKLSLADKFALFEGKLGTLEGTYEIPEGEDIEKAIQSILLMDDRTGAPLDMKPILYDEAFKGKKMPYTLSKDAGGNFGEILLEIGTILNAEVFYNSTGNLVYMSINETMNDANKPIQWHYLATENDLIQVDGTYAFEDVINEVHVVGDNVNNDLIWAWARNEDIASPISIPHIGRRIEYINDSNIPSEDYAKLRAIYELRRNSFLKTTFTLTVPYNFTLMVNNLITITDEFYGFEQDKFLIQSIEYNIGDDNQVTLTVANINNYNVSGIV